MKQGKSITTRTADELAKALGLKPEDAIEFDVRRKLVEKIADVVAELRLTHEQAAVIACTSRSRLTAILNGNTQHVSTDLMLRILASLGYSANITFRRLRRAA